MAKINDYTEVTSSSNLPESAMLVIEFGSNGGTKKISATKLIEDLSGKVDYVSYSGDISTHNDYASPSTVYCGNVNTNQGTSGYARTVVVGNDSGTIQARIATFIQGRMFYQTRSKSNGSWGSWGSWSAVSMTIPNGSISEEQLTSALQSKINDVYTRAEVDSRIAAVSGLTFKVVNSLPTTNISPSTIYLVQDGSAYQKWVYIDNSWVNLGSSDIDMSSKVDKTTRIAGVQISDGISSTLLRAGLSMPRIFRREESSSISHDVEATSTTIGQSTMTSWFGVTARTNDLLIIVYTNYRVIMICTGFDNTNAVFERADACYTKVDRTDEIAGLPIGSGIDKSDLQQALGINEPVYLYSYSLVGEDKDTDKSIPINWIKNQHRTHDITTGDLLYGIYYRYLYVCTGVTSTHANFTPINKIISDNTLVTKSTRIADIQINTGITKVALSNSLCVPRMWHTFEPLIDGDDYGRGQYSEKFVPLSNLQIGNTDVHTDDELTDYHIQEADFVYSMDGEGLYMAEVMGADTIEIDGESVSGWWLEPIKVAEGSIDITKLAPNLQGYFIESLPIFSDEIHRYTDPTTGNPKYGTNYPLSSYNKHLNQPIVLRDPNFVGNGVRRTRFFIVTSMDCDMINQKVNRIEASVSSLNDGVMTSETIVFERTENTSDLDPVYFDVVDTPSEHDSVVVHLTPVYSGSSIIKYTSDLTLEDAIAHIQNSRYLMFVASDEGANNNVYGEYFSPGSSSYDETYNSVRFDLVNLKDIYEGVFYYKTLEGLRNSTTGYIDFSVIEDDEFDLDSKADQENGNISVTAPEYWSGSEPQSAMMTGTYQLIGEYCTITATATAVNGWTYTFYRLPVALDPTVVPMANILALCIAGNTEYVAKIDTTNSINCINIYRRDGQQNSSDVPVSFTITYRYTNSYSRHSRYTQAELDEAVANREAEIERQLAEI